jgi:hypothetical protein
MTKQSSLPKNILGTGILSTEEEAKLIADGAKYVYYQDSAVKGNPPVLIVFNCSPEVMLEDMWAFERKHGFRLLDVYGQADPSKTHLPVAETAPVPELSPAV